MVIPAPKLYGFDIATHPGFPKDAIAFVDHRGKLVGAIINVNPRPKIAPQSNEDRREQLGRNP